ncbi:MAG: ABC transporter permease [Candidatus Woesearchaeota archaeon]|nr:MAG: ABC transporter permease [Candidatus Woesearchaeota archaeon]
MLEDYFRLSISNLIHRKLRSWLTIIGIMIGIAAVVALISIGQGMQQSISEQFEKVGSNRIIITPGGGTSMAAGPFSSDLMSAKLYEEDVDIVKRARGIDYAAGGLIKTANIQFKDKTKSTTIFAFSLDSETKKYIEDIDFLAVDTGKYPSESDRYKAVIGPGLADGFFTKQIKIGDTITIDGEEFQVVGITNEAGNPVHDNKVMIPLRTAREMFDMPEEVMSIFAKTQEGFDINDVVENVEKDLRRAHNVDEGEEDFTVQTANQLIEGFTSILNIIQIVLVGIAAISLLVGSIGIMNTMYTSVLERTKDIGIMKSVGAKNSHVMLLFLIESALLGFVGGVIGCMLGVLLSRGASIAAAYQGIDILKTSVSSSLIIGALSFSTFVGGLSGLLPARKAAKMKPVDALHAHQ